MPGSTKKLVAELFRDIVLIDAERYPDWKAAGREWAEKLKAIHPCNIVRVLAGEDVTTFGVKLTDADRAKFEEQGALVVKPQVEGHA